MRPVTAYAILALIALVAACSGCASAPQALPERVLIPVPVDCPRPDLPSRPALPLADLGDNASPADVVRAYAATVEVLAGYAQELEVLISPEGAHD